MNLVNSKKRTSANGQTIRTAVSYTAMKTLIKKSLLLAFLFLSTLSSLAQVDREFWFTIPKENDKHGYDLTATYNASLKITAQQLNANVTINMPLNGAFTPITVNVTAGTTQVVSLANSFAQFANIYANPGALDGIPQDGYTNRGLHILSDNDITVYYDYNNQWNRDLWSLKGKNALGTEFYTPFQNINSNGTTYTDRATNTIPIAYSDISMVATVDGTQVTITPTQATKGGWAANTTHTIILNAGQTYSVVANSQTAAGHLTGTHITSTQPIAVTINDDSDPVTGGGGCYDINGDQLVPVSVLGSKYLVMCGTSSVTSAGAATQVTARGEQVFVVSTKPNTTVTYQDRAGTLLRTSPVLAAGGYDHISPNILDTLQDAIYIAATNPIYVYHITGIGCETGGALLPPITNCTGSQSVTFYRAADLTDLTLNLMIPYDTSIPFNSPTQSYNFFTVTYQNGTTASIPGSWFEPVPGAGWAVLKGGCTAPLNKPSLNDIKRYFSSSPTVTANNAFIPAGQAVKVENTKDFFHLGITNGTTGATDKYGYFSSFNVVSASARVAQTEFPIYLSCFGDTVNFQAYGGISYQWHYGGQNAAATTYLSDPTSPTPQVFCPPGTHYFYVTVHRPTCFGDVTLPVTLTVLPEVIAAFETDKTSDCSPMTVNFTNTSKGANQYEWTRKIGSGIETTFIPLSTNFAEGPLTNKTMPYAPINYVYKLKASNSGACKDSTKKTITIYPEIRASFLPNDTTGCAPLLVKFRNLSSGNVTDSSYYWNFGDQNTSIIKVPSHLYNNYFTATDTTYNVRMVATSPYMCRDTANQKITVHPYIKAGFTVDTAQGCSPFFIKIYNNSLNRKAISKYFWDFNYKSPAVNPRDTSTTGDRDTLYHSFPRNLTNTPIVYKVLLTVYHKFGAGCPDTISRTVIVYPEGKISIITPDTTGCNQLMVKFRANADPGVTQYLWKFGDAGTSDDANPIHQFNNLTNNDITYRITVKTSSPQYCSGYDTVNVTVHAKLNPVFSIDVPRTCAPYNATVSNNSDGGITNYFWDFGDGNWSTSSAPSLKHLYRNNSTVEKTYTVKLIVGNSGGCKDSVSHDISLYPEVHAQFNTPMGSYCSPRQVDFVNQSNAMATKFIWKFGDNATSMTRDTIHYYTNNSQRDTIYYAWLVAISDDNCKDSLKSLPILVYPYMEASFSLDTANGCNPLTVKFTNGSLGPYTSPNATLSWNFGDGTPWWTPGAPIPQTTSHTFFNNGQQTKPYNITLRIIYNTLLCPKASTSKSISVYAPVNLKVSPNNLYICNKSEITFRDSSHFNNVAYNYNWDFGDGSSSANIYPLNKSQTVVLKHQYENFFLIYYTYKAKLTAFSQRGCQVDTTFNITVFPEVKASFSFNDPGGCSPFTIPLNEGSTTASTWKRFWDDETSPSMGFPYTYLPPSLTYRNDTSTANKVFKPKLKVAYIYNGSPVCPDSTTRTVTVYPKVTAYFAAKDSFKICHPGAVHFANGSRIGNYKLLQNDNRLAYKWTFGDNGSSSDYEPIHSYNNFSSSNSAVNTIWLKVNSTYDCKDSISRIVTIYPKPEANFYIDNSMACTPFNVQIYNVSDAEGGSMFNWKFNGIGNDTITRIPVETLYHLFTNSGATTIAHLINLQITTPHNCTDTTSQLIYVYPPVIADFDKDTAGCNPFNVAFVNKSKQSDSWFWDFGEVNNISTSKAKNPLHTFLNNSINDSTYTIFMRAVSKVGCHDSTYRKVTVYPQPEASFEADRYYFTFSPTSNVVNFTNFTTPDAAWNYVWNYDDGLPSDRIKGPTSHEFLLGPPHWGGQFNVKLSASSDHCRDSVYHRITIVAPKPVADFSISENGCVPLDISFTELTSYGTSWFWEFGDGGTYNGQNPPPYTYTKAGKYNIKLTVTGDGGVSYAFKDVEVYPKPVVNFDLKPNLVMLTEKMEAKVQFYNKCQLGEKFMWNFGDSAKSSETAPYHIYKSIGRYTVQLEAWTAHQCYDKIIKRDTVEVLERHEIQFPNAFTPNVNGQNDGKYTTPDTKNEVFHPTSKGIVEFHLEIYDRWGEKLFESDDINIGWNGYYKGKLCKTDVYIWKAKGKYTDGGTFEKAGNLTLLR